MGGVTDLVFIDEHLGHDDSIRAISKNQTVYIPFDRRLVPFYVFFDSKSVEVFLNIRA